VVKQVIVLGGGSAGFMAALALKVRLPHLRISVIRSKDIGIIGVGEGSTVALTEFLHGYLKIAHRKFLQVAQPTWKLGLKFIWGPRGAFNYPFGAGPDARLQMLPKPIGFYFNNEGDMEGWDAASSLMSQDKAFPRAAPGGGPDFRTPHAYHFENEKFVHFLEDYATALGIPIIDDTVATVNQDEHGITGLALASGRTETADLYVDCSGFVSLLLGKTLGEPFVSYDRSLLCDRAVAGGWDREGAEDEVIRPYTTCETMNSGWAWRIDHEARINRGYVYSSAFISDEEAEREFRERNPKVARTRVVRFVTGRYARRWVKNVVAVGNASGFVEPLEATALGMIGTQSTMLAETLADADGDVTASQIDALNRHHARVWDAIRNFLAVHYRFNTKLDTPFWKHCREHVDLAGAGDLVNYYRENGPTRLWTATLLDVLDPHQVSGYATLLMGQGVPFRRQYRPTAAEVKAWEDYRRRMRENASQGWTVRQTLEAIRSPKWKWVASG
jgi:tryptophan halogenase